MIAQCRKLALRGSSKAIGEGTAGTVGVDDTAAQAAFADSVRLLHHGDTLFQQFSQTATSMRREQRRKTRGTPADDDYSCALNAQCHLLCAAQIAGDAILCVLARDA